MLETCRLYEEDSTLQKCSAKVVDILENNIILDRTIAYPTGGGQQGDTGMIITSGGASFRFDAAYNLPGRIRIAHPITISEADETQKMPAVGPAVGDEVQLEIDWHQRFRRMRLHSALHLLCGLISAPVTGCAIGDDHARIDFDLPESEFTKEQLTQNLNEQVILDRNVSAKYISLEEFHNTPDLVRTTAVSPPEMPKGVRIVTIDDFDTQACGGTHVKSTGSIGEIIVDKIKKKSKLNRRISIALCD